MEHALVPPEIVNDVESTTRILCNLFPFTMETFVKMYRHQVVHKEETKVPINLNVDWDRFRNVFDALSSSEQKTAVAERRLEYLNCQLLHLVCMSDAPTDIVQMLLQASHAPVTSACGLKLEATPLHCASLESSAKVVELLLSADVDKVALMRQDALGRLPLHNACICGLDGEAPGVVKLLLDADQMKRSIAVQDKSGSTPLMLSCQFSSGTIVGYLLDASLEADGIEECHFKIADLSNDPLLHRALLREARRSSTGNVLKLIIESVIVKDNIFVQDRRGQIPLHHAVRHGAAKSAFQTLIDADLKGTTFHTPDYLNQTPFDLLVRRVHNGRASAVETLSIIVETDTNRRFFGLEDEHERTPLDKFCKSLGFREDITQIQKEFLRLLLMATPAGSGDYTGSLPKARSYLGRTKYESIYTDRRMHNTLNNMMWKRSFTTHFMLDLYVRILLLFSYSIATNRAVLGLEISKLYFAIVYLCSIYLILWQVQLIGRHELYYLWDGWNLLDLATEILVVLSAAMLRSGRELDEGVRVLVTITGGMIWAVVMVSALRSTFLPFAVFVRGFTRILVYMIPFAITTFLLLGAFAEMYFKTTVNTADCADYDFCNYGASFLAVYVMFVGGLDTSLLTTETSKNLFWLTLFYSFLFAVVMLNILVAVIFDAWGEVSPQGRFYFWRFRHEFLIETSQTAFGRLFNGVRIQALNVVDEHVNSTADSFASRPALVHESDESVVDKSRHCIMFAVEGLYLLLWCGLGLVTAGVLWPGIVRRQIFTVAMEENLMESDPAPLSTNEDPKGENVLQMKQELEAMKETFQLELKSIQSSMEKSMEEMRELVISLRPSTE